MTHSSIRLIKEHTTQLDNRFSFYQITYVDIHKEIKKTRLHQGFSGY